MPKPTPERVFTPNAVASADMFARRNEPDRFGNPGLQDRYVQSLLQIGAQIRVFGDTGVGKTSLAIIGAGEAEMKPLVVQCRSSQDFGQIIEQAICGIRGLRLASYTTRKELSSAVSGEGGWRWLASIRGEITGSAAKERQFERIDKHPIDLLTDLMVEQGYSILILDNFHNIRDESTRREIAQTMEVLADRATATRNLTLVAIGIAESADGLLTSSPSVRRRTIDIGVPRMPDQEIEAVFEKGFRLLGLQVPKELLEHLVYFADGFPFYAHLLGLNVSRASGLDEARVVSRAHVGAALLRTTNEVEETYSTLIRSSIAQATAKTSIVELLKLLAGSRTRSWSTREVQDLWRANSPDSDRIPGLRELQEMLESLAANKENPLLRLTGLGSPPAYRFADPHLRTYLRLASESGLVGLDELEWMEDDSALSLTKQGSGVIPSDRSVLHLSHRRIEDIDDL